MAMVFDMASGELITPSARPASTPGRPLPLHAPGASPCLCPVVAAGGAGPPVLPREVVLPLPAALRDAPD